MPPAAARKKQPRPLSPDPQPDPQTIPISHQQEEAPLTKRLPLSESSQFRQQHRSRAFQARDPASGSNPEGVALAGEGKQRGAARKLHPASAVSDAGCEPRARLLWSIVGQASSVCWEQRTQPQLSGETVISCDSQSPAAGTPPSDRPLPSELEQKRRHEGPLQEAAGCDEVERSEESAQSREAGLGGQELSRDCRSPGTQAEACPGAEWGSLPPELLSIVASHTVSAAAVHQMVSTCRWYLHYSSNIVGLRIALLLLPLMPCSFSFISCERRE